MSTICEMTKRFCVNAVCAAGTAIVAGAVGINPALVAAGGIGGIAGTIIAGVGGMFVAEREMNKAMGLGIGSTVVVTGTVGAVVKTAMQARNVEMTASGVLLSVEIGGTLSIVLGEGLAFATRNIRGSDVSAIVSGLLLGGTVAVAFAPSLFGTILTTAVIGGAVAGVLPVVQPDWVQNL